MSLGNAKATWTAVGGQRGEAIDVQVPYKRLETRYAHRMKSAKPSSRYGPLEALHIFRILLPPNGSLK